MQWSDDIRIETPEQIDLSLEVAGLGSRFVAKVLDGLIKWGTLLLAGLLVLVVLVLLDATSLGKTLPVLLIALLVALVYAFLLSFDIYYEVRHNGQTPGKKAAGIRVRREGGAPLDFRSACVRNLLSMADFLPICYLLGALLVLLNRRGQRLGDMAAGTIVIRERAVQPPAQLDGEIKSFALDGAAFTAEQLSACSPGDRHILRSFFQRYRQMEAQPRYQLAERLREAFLKKMPFQPAAPIMDDARAEAFLATLYRDLESWAKHGR
jgi:uncharacterized RDD family membrane protein YckC